jgi:site-specific recombinase XerD
MEGLRKLQQRVGHSSITTTAHYLQFAFEEQREEVEKVLGEVIA